MSSIEYLLDPKNKRTRLYPIIHHDIWEFYDKHLSMFWTASEIVLKKDLNHWRNVLTDSERYYIKLILAFFSISDFLVNDNQYKDSDEIHILEYKFFNDSKIERENTHAHTYANMIDTYINDEEEKNFLFDSIKTIPSVKQKAEWLTKYICESDFVHRLVACAITEGIFFCGSFCGIFWLKKRGLMQGLCDANELISRDEGVHRDFACMIYKKYIMNKLPVDEVITMIKHAVEIEKKFVCESLPVSLIGMNSNLMSLHIEFVADDLCMSLIDQKIYKSDDPFPWTDSMKQDIKTNFFESRVTSYAKQTIITRNDNKEFNENEDF
jgi:ribonucleoside-diphosphate reductase beta chain